MRESRRDPIDVAVTASTVAAAAIIAEQVGAKAARDALFLQHFDVDLLPRVLGAAALVAIPVVFASTRLLGRFGPARVVPWAFAGSALVLTVLTALANSQAAMVAVLLYFHVACLGAVLVSGFWSVVNERFDPNTARRSIGRIGFGATVGGVLGGLCAAALGRALGPNAMLALLAGLHALAAFAIARAVGDFRAERGTSTSGAPEGLSVIASQPYLRHLVALVVVMTVAATCLDFVFKDLAQRAFTAPGSRWDLVTFFGVFHTGLALFTLAVQGSLARVLLDRAGLARTAATHPLGLGLGAMAVLSIGSWPVAMIARALEAALRSSLFRSAYELFYTPLAAREKRAAKAIVDVGGERAGDAIGALVVQAAVMVLPAAGLVGRHEALLVVAVGLSVAGLVLTRLLHQGYVRTLERSLRERHVALHDVEARDQTTRTLVLRRATAMPEPPPDVRSERRGRGLRVPVSDGVLSTIAELRCGEPRRVMRTLATAHPLSPELTGHVVALLAWDAVAEEAIDALRATGRRAAGTLIDAMLDPAEEFTVRRRAPRAIGGPLDAIIARGLVEGLRAERFEIRYQAARALARLTGDEPLALEASSVLDRVLAEVSVPSGVWDAHRVLDTPRRDYRLDGRAGEGRVPAPLHHVFTLLSFVLPPESVQIAMHGVLSRDAMMRGTALEYLESVLPTAIRDRLWAHLERMPLETPHRVVAEDTQLLRAAMRTQTSLRATFDAALSPGPDPS